MNKELFYDSSAKAEIMLKGFNVHTYLSNADGKEYIHADSLDIFHLRIGDLISVYYLNKEHKFYGILEKKEQLCFYVRSGSNIKVCPRRTAVIEIIKRNGKVFFMPEDYIIMC